MIIHRAPWKDRLPSGELGQEYDPVSVRTGRRVSHDRAEADYAEKYGSLRAIPVADDHSPVESVRVRPDRHDQKTIEGWVSRFSHRLSQQELDVYVSFWIERRSYSEAASDLDLEKDSVREAVKRIRRKAGVRVIAGQKSY